MDWEKQNKTSLNQPKKGKKAKRGRKKEIEKTEKKETVSQIENT